MGKDEELASVPKAAIFRTGQEEAWQTNRNDSVLDNDKSIQSAPISWDAWIWDIKTGN